MNTYALAGEYATAALMSVALPKEQRGTELDPLVVALPDGHASAAQNAAVELIAGAFDSPTGNKAFLRTMLRRWAMKHQESAPPEPPKPKTIHEIVVAFDVRAWVTFEADDLTPEQIEMLKADFQDETGGEALAAMRDLLESGHMREIDFQTEDNLDPLSGYNNPSIIDFRQGEGA